MRYSTHSSQDRAYIQSIDRSNSSTFYPLNLEGSKFNFNGGNVGIGTDEPSATLHLGSQNEEIRFGDGTTNRSSLVFKGHNTGTTFVDRYAIKSVGGSSGEAHVWQDDTGTAEMTLLNNGNLGIGETAPTYKLDVNGIMRTTDNARINQAWIGNWDSNDNYAQFTHHAIKDTTSSYALMQDSGGNTLLNAANTKVIAFKINAIEKMRLDASGNLGIGTDNPVGLVDLNC